jgi:hypothetical protein
MGKHLDLTNEKPDLCVKNGLKRWEVKVRRVGVKRR